MKVLFDPIYSTQPSRCSSAAKYRKIAQLLLAEREDVFIYWLVPMWADDDSKAWMVEGLPANRVKLIYTDASKDRVREYQTYGADLENLIAFFGECWDYDVLITMRTAQVPTMRVSMNSPRYKRQGWLKKCILLEEMAIFDFRETVPVSAPAVQDALSTLGYLASDVSYITANHVRDGIITAAKGIYTPSKIIELRNKLRLVNPAIVEDYSTKAPEHRFKRGKEPFCLGFVGRMSNSTTRLPDVYEVMDKSWIMKGDQGFKVIISTVSTGVKLPPPDFAIFENNPREKFWARVKEDMHLVISLSIDAEFSMSLIEPVLFGTPLVIAKEDWTIGLLGKEYPFFVNGKIEAYAMVKAFHDNYEAMYASFLEWRETHFKPRFQKGGLYERSLYKDLMAEVATFDTDTAALYKERHPRRGDNQVVQDFLKFVEKRDEIVILDVFKEMDKSGAFRNLGQKLEDQAGIRNTTFMTPWHEMKVVLQGFHGWEDASLTLGHMKRKK